MEKAKRGTAENAAKIKWIESDVLEFIPPEKYDLWHDRATFHFLTTPENQKKYIQIAYKALKDNS
ncbi:MAG: SAM-dependent methyltransferase, partial [Chitinophagaceae bacterium]